MIEKDDKQVLAERAAALLKLVQFNGWTFHVGHEAGDVWLQVRFYASGATGPEAYDLRLQHGRKWRLSPHMVNSEIIRTAFLAVTTAVEHETRERFTYKGARVFGPHIDVEQLAEIAKKVEVRS